GFDQFLQAVRKVLLLAGVAPLGPVNRYGMDGCRVIVQNPGEKHRRAFSRKAVADACIRNLRLQYDALRTDMLGHAPGEVDQLVAEADAFVDDVPQLIWSLDHPGDGPRRRVPARPETRRRDQIEDGSQGTDNSHLVFHGDYGFLSN